MQNNNDTLKYLNIMIESLNKKLVMYGQLLTKTKSQSDCISGKEFEDANWSQFEVLMIEKESLIERINEIDEGFDKLFERVKADLDNNKSAYADEIKKLQTAITSLTDMGVKISASEERNRLEIERIMTAAKAGIGKARRNMKATSGYITSMYGGGIVPDPTKIDNKN